MTYSIPLKIKLSIPTGKYFRFGTREVKQILESIDREGLTLDDVNIFVRPTKYGWEEK